MRDHNTMSIYPEDDNNDRGSISLTETEQWRILKNNLKMLYKIKAFPKTLTKDTLHAKVGQASHAELLKAKNKINKIACRLRFIQTLILTFLFIGMITFFLPFSLFVMLIVASALLIGSLILMGIALFDQKVKLFKNAHHLLKLSDDFLKPLEYEVALSLAPKLPLPLLKKPKS